MDVAFEGLIFGSCLTIFLCERTKKKNNPKAIAIFFSVYKATWHTGHHYQINYFLKNFLVYFREVDGCLNILTAIVTYAFIQNSVKPCYSDS